MILNLMKCLRKVLALSLRISLRFNLTCQDEYGNKRLSLDSLPYGIRKLLFTYMDGISQACVGVTCKAFYTIYRKHCHRISFSVSDPLGRPGLTLETGVLYMLLKNWMGPNLLYAPWRGKFITKENFVQAQKDFVQERYRRLEEQSEREMLFSVVDWESGGGSIATYGSDEQLPTLARVGRTLHALPENMDNNVENDREVMGCIGQGVKAATRFVQRSLAELGRGRTGGNKP
jgi:hypothetical protein